jgi:hypothetical protein
LNVWRHTEVFKDKRWIPRAYPIVRFPKSNPNEVRSSTLDGLPCLSFEFTGKFERLDELRQVVDSDELIARVVFLNGDVMYLKLKPGGHSLRGSLRNLGLSCLVLSSLCWLVLSGLY